MRPPAELKAIAKLTDDRDAKVEITKEELADLLNRAVLFFINGVALGAIIAFTMVVLSMVVFSTHH